MSSSLPWHLHTELHLLGAVACKPHDSTVALTQPALSTRLTHVFRPAAVCAQKGDNKFRLSRKAVVLHDRGISLPQPGEILRCGPRIPVTPGKA